VKNIKTGRKGESLAAEWLTKNGYEILFQNWRYGRHEIDIVATKNNICHCFEVKTRRGSKYGYPEQSIGNKKLRNIMAAAGLFESRKECNRDVQVNILAINFENNSASYFLIENAGLGYRL
jgi:putative endonuclease